MAALLRPGNASSNTASDHIEIARLTLAQLPKHLRRGRKTLIRTDSAGGTHALLDWLSRGSRWLSYSVGMTITDPPGPAEDPEEGMDTGQRRQRHRGARCLVAEVTDMPDLSSWPKDIRMIVRKERPHPGVQLRFTDLDGLQLTCFATNTKKRPARQPGITSPPPGPHPKRPRHRPAQPAPARHRPEPDLAGDRPDRTRLLAWMPMLALTGETRRWEPKRVRLRLFSAAAQLVTTGIGRWLRFTARWPWTDLITWAIQRLTTLPNPG